MVAQVQTRRVPDVLGRVDHALSQLRGRRLPWLACAFASGVALYFALPSEPGLVAFRAILAACVAALVTARILPGGWAVVVLVGAMTLGGIAAAQWRAQGLAAPVLPFRYHGPIEGRIVAIDRSASGAVRLTLDGVRLDGVRAAVHPRRVRVSLHDDGATPAVDALSPGLRIMTTGFLSPPAGPTEPGGFDFQRHAWFLGLGAVGYSRVPVVLAQPSAQADVPRVARLRHDLAASLRDRVDGAAGAVAAAIVTGDRSALPPGVVEDLRASNLAHLLAISGLHMALLVGVVFGVVRCGLALWPPIALRYDTRRWAAVAALPVAAGYLVLSGGGVATQRAFVMAAVMLGAILLGRRALSLRSVALAGLVVLLVRPESLYGPGFQMSFAATGALVVAFQAWTRHGPEAWRGGWRGALAALVLSSLVAGFATAPFAAAHFNRVGQFGLLANLMAVPTMGLWIMPLLLLGLVLTPLGAGTLPLKMAGWGIDYVLWVAAWIADLPQAVRHVPAPDGPVLPLLGLGLAVMLCATGRGRLVGAGGIAVAIALWGAGTRPPILVSESGRLVGILGAEGRWLSRARSDGFTAAAWLENDGDAALQADAAARLVPSLPIDVLHATRRDALDRHLATCRPGWDVVVTPHAVETETRCRVFDGRSLRSTGAVALTPHADGLAVRTARDAQGRRPWTGHGVWRGDRPGRPSRR